MHFASAICIDLARICVMVGVAFKLRAPGLLRLSQRYVQARVRDPRTHAFRLDEDVALQEQRLHATDEIAELSRCQRGVMVMDVEQTHEPQTLLRVRRRDTATQHVSWQLEKAPLSPSTYCGWITSVGRLVRQHHRHRGQHATKLALGGGATVEPLLGERQNSRNHLDTAALTAVLLQHRALAHQQLLTPFFRVPHVRHERMLVAKCVVPPRPESGLGKQRVLGGDASSVRPVATDEAHVRHGARRQEPEAFLDRGASICEADVHFQLDRLEERFVDADARHVRNAAKSQQNRFSHGLGVVVVKITNRAGRRDSSTP